MQKQYGAKKCLVFAVFTIRVLKNPKYQGKASNAAIFSPNTPILSLM